METAGFHPVNYSVAHSAPQRGGRRESESEPPHSRAGDTQEAGPEAGSSRGQRAPQEAGLCPGVPGPQPRPPGPQVSARAHSPPGVLESQRAQGEGGRHPESRSQAASPSVVGSMQRWQLTGGRQPRCPRGWEPPQVKPSPRGRGGRASAQSSWRHRSCPTPPLPPPRGWALGCGCRFYTLLLPRACRGQSLAPFLTCSAGPGAGVPTASSPSAAGLCPGEGRPRRTEFCTGGEGHGPRNTGLSGRLDKQSQCHPPRGCAMIARRSPEGFQVTGHRSSGLEPGPGAGRHSPRPGPGPAPAAERPSAHTVPSRRPHPARLPKDSAGEGGSSGWGALPCNSPQ